MNTYAVSFKFETGIDIYIEADSEDEARELARKEMDDKSVDRLPEMWPEDYELDTIEEIQP